MREDAGDTPVPPPVTPGDEELRRYDWALADARHRVQALEEEVMRLESSLDAALEALVRARIHEERAARAREKAARRYRRRSP